MVCITHGVFSFTSLNTRSMRFLRFAYRAVPRSVLRSCSTKSRYSDYIYGAALSSALFCSPRILHDADNCGIQTVCFSILAPYLCQLRYAAESFHEDRSRCLLLNYIWTSKVRNVLLRFWTRQPLEAASCNGNAVSNFQCPLQGQVRKCPF